VDRKIGWGILGCAAIAEKAFIPAVLGSRNGRLAAIAARDEARARDWAARFDILTVPRSGPSGPCGPASTSCARSPWP
jgi:predicted dehydrogenase